MIPRSTFLLIQVLLVVLPLIFWRWLPISSLKLAVGLFMLLLFGSVFFLIMTSQYRKVEGSSMVANGLAAVGSQLVCLALIYYYSHQIWLLLGK